MGEGRLFDALVRSRRVVEDADNLVTAFFKDLGESPEAMRGAVMFAQMLHGTASVIIGDTRHPDERDEQQIETEMISVALGTMSIVKKFSERAHDLIPPAMGFDS